MNILLRAMSSSKTNTCAIEITNPESVNLNIKSRKILLLRTDILLFFNLYFFSI